MIFIDSNVPMYVVGAAHPNKQAAQQRLEELVVAGEALISDAEVLQEILHRYHSIDRREAIQPAFDVLWELLDEVLAIEAGHAERAKEIVTGASRLSARDAIHVAVMESVDCDRILSFDRGFDGHPGVSRLS